jgi:hypothetical protein
LTPFTGPRAQVESWLVASVARHYVYVLHRPDGTPFYVGKGTGRRVFEHELEARRAHPVGESNPYKCNVIRSIERAGHAMVYTIDSVHETEQPALDREGVLIAQYRRLHEGGPLTNLAPGGGTALGPAPLTRTRHADTLAGSPAGNSQRATLNAFLQAIGPVASVPVKPIEQIGRIVPTTPHRRGDNPTLRAVYALIASASAHGLKLTPGVRIPRSFVFEGVRGIIENGVARRILAGNVAGLIPAEAPQDETFVLDARQCALVVQMYGADALRRRGLVD